MAQLVECPFCDLEVVGSTHSLVIPKTLRMVLAALPLGSSIKKVVLGIRTGQPGVSIM